MKETGIIRGLDELGRVVLPIELRRSFNLSHKDEVEIFVDDDYILLKRHEAACTFCGDSTGVVKYMGKAICTCCIKSLFTSIN